MIDRSRRLLECLPDSNLPADLQAWLRELFTHQPVYMGLEERDELIRLAVSLSPGESRTAKCSYFIDCFCGRSKHPAPTAERVLVRLKVSGVTVPKGVKQLMRILEGRRQDG